MAASLPSMMSPKTPLDQDDLDWEAHRDTIEDLYVLQRKPLDAVIDHMRLKYEFEATKRQYTRRLQSWKIRKNVSSKEWQQLGVTLRRIGVEADVFITNSAGKKVYLPPAKVRKAVGRSCTASEQNKLDNGSTTPTPLRISILPKTELLAGPQETDGPPTLDLPWHEFDNLFRMFASTRDIEAKASNQPTGADPRKVAHHHVTERRLDVPKSSAQPAVHRPDRVAGFSVSIPGNSSPGPQTIHNESRGRPFDSILRYLRFLCFILSNNMAPTTRQPVEKLLRPAIAYDDSALLKQLIQMPGFTAEAVVEKLVQHAMSHHQFLHLLLQHGLDPNRHLTISRCPIGQNLGPHTLLFAAAGNSSLHVVKLLVAYGADVDGSHTILPCTYSPLDAAILSGKTENAKYLLDRGASPNIQGQRGTWLLRHALHQHHPEFPLLLHTPPGSSCNLGNEASLSMIQTLLQAGLELGCEVEERLPLGRQMPFASCIIEQVASYGHLEAIKLLHGEGAQLTTDALYFAARGGSSDIVDYLIEHGADLLTCPASGHCAIRGAVENSNRPLAMILIVELGAILEAKTMTWADAASDDSPPCTSHRVACAAGVPKLESALISAGAAMSSALDGLQHGSDLMWASPAHKEHEFRSVPFSASPADIENADPAMVEGYNAGANIDCSYEETPMVQSLHEIWPFVEKQPLERDVNNMGFSSNTTHTEDDKTRALMSAIDNGHLSTLDALLDQGTDVNAHRNGQTALQKAVEEGRIDFVKSLMKHRADVNGPPANFSGRTALQMAVEKHYPPIIELLLDANADVNAPPAREGGVTALQAAAIVGHFSIVRLLLARGALVDAPGSCVMGRTALEGAAERGRLDIVKLLLGSGAELECYNDDINDSSSWNAKALQYYEGASTDRYLFSSNKCGSNCKHYDFKTEPTGTQYERAMIFAGRSGHFAVRRMLQLHYRRHWKKMK